MRVLFALFGIPLSHGFGGIIQGNLLDDGELIGVLAATKATEEEITEKLAITSETRIKITEACEEYRAVAARATEMYFLISNFAAVNAMYQVRRHLCLLLVSQSNAYSDADACSCLHRHLWSSLLCCTEQQSMQLKSRICQCGELPT